MRNTDAVSGVYKPIMGMNLPADVWIAPGGAGAVAAAAVLTAVTLASIRQRTFRWRGRKRIAPLASHSQPVVALDTSSEVPLLQGKYRNRAFRMAVSPNGILIVTLGLATQHQQGLEIGTGATSAALPFGPLSFGRLSRLPAPWSLAIRGKRLWLSVSGDEHDPLVLRRRLELACDLADEWDTAVAR